MPYFIFYVHNYCFVGKYECPYLIPNITLSNPNNHVLTVWQALIHPQNNAYLVKVTASQ